MLQAGARWLLGPIISGATQETIDQARDGAHQTVEKSAQTFFINLLKQSPPILVKLHQAIEMIEPGKENEDVKRVEEAFNAYLKPSSRPPKQASEKEEVGSDTEELTEFEDESFNENKPTPAVDPLKKASQLNESEIAELQHLIDVLKQALPTPPNDDTVNTTNSTSNNNESTAPAGKPLLRDKPIASFQEAKKQLDDYLLKLIGEKSGMLQHAMTQLTEALTSRGGTFDSFATSIRTSMAAALADPAPKEVIDAEAKMSALLVSMRNSSEHNIEPAKVALNKLVTSTGYSKLPFSEGALDHFHKINKAFQDNQPLLLTDIERTHQYLFDLRCNASGLVPRVLLSALDTGIKQLAGLFGLNIVASAEEGELKKESELDKALAGSAIGHPAAAPSDTSSKPKPIDLRSVTERIQEQRALFVQNAFRTALAFRTISWCPEAQSKNFAKTAIDIVKSTQKDTHDVFIGDLRQSINKSGWNFYKRWGAKFEILTTQSMLEYFLARITDKVFEAIEKSIPVDTAEARERLLDSGICYLIDDLSAINEIYEVINREEGHTAGIEAVIDAKLKDHRLYGKLQPANVESKFFRQLLLDYVPEVSFRTFLSRKLENFRFSNSYFILRLFNLVLALVTNIVWALLFPIVYVIDQIATFLLRALVKFTPLPNLIRNKLFTGDQKSKFGKAYSHAINSVLLTKLKEIEASLKAPPSGTDSKATDSRFVGEILSETAKGNVQKLVANISLLLENQRYRTYTQLRTDKASQPFQSVNTISRLSLTIFGIDLNIKSAASEEAAKQLASVLSSLLRKDQIEELLCSTLKSVNESLLSTETVSDSHRANTESALFGQLHQIVNTIIRQAIEGQLQPELRYQAYVDKFMGNVKMACGHLTAITDFSKETSSSLTEKKNALLRDFTRLRTSLVTDIGNTKNHPLDKLLAASIEPLCAFFNRNIQPLITQLGAMESTIAKLQEKQNRLEALHKLAEQIPTSEALLSNNLEEIQKLADGLATEADLKDLLISIPDIRKGLLEQYNKKRSLEDLASAYFLKEATIEALHIDDIDKIELKNRLAEKKVPEYARALANNKYRVNFDPFKTFIEALSEKKVAVAQELKAAETKKKKHLEEVQKQIQAFKELAEKPTTFKCQPVHFLKYVSNEQVRFTILQIITNLVAAEILPDVKQAPASASKGYLNAFFVSRMMSRAVGNVLPITTIPPYNAGRA